MSADTAASPERCAIYTRVSTEEQGREGASLGVQLQACRRHAAALGWVVVDELQDVQSGLDTERAAYQRALDLARARAVDVVLVWRLDRFGRDDAEALPRLAEFARLQVRVVSATEGDQSTFLQKLMFLLANEESRRTSERVRPAMRRRVEEGLWMSQAPFGYRMDPAARGRLVVDDATAPIVRELFRRAANGERVHMLTEWVNALTLADGTAMRSPRGVWFGDGVVRDILRNPVYIGIVRWNLTSQSKLDGFRALPAAEHVVAPGLHVPLIEPDTFERAGAQLSRVAKRSLGRTRRQFLLAGLVRCGVCGKSTPGQLNYGPHATFYRYRCRKRSHGEMAGPRLDARILAEIAALPLTDDILASTGDYLRRDTAERPDRGAEFAAQRRRHEDRRRRLTMYLADGTLEPADYRAAIAEVEAAIAVVDREREAYAPPTGAEAVLADVAAWLEMARGLGRGTLAAILPGAAPEDRAALVAAAIDHITIHRGREPDIAWRPWVEALRAAAQQAVTTGTQAS